jgi:hypothetical protein
MEAGTLRKMKRLLKNMVIALIIILMATLIYFQMSFYPALDSASSCYTNNPNATIEGGMITFKPVHNSPTVGVIIYPGGNVDFAAYAPLAAQISAGGYPVYLLRMPMNLAVFGINRANEVIQSNPQINHWIMMGHSLGGSMAARFSKSHTQQVSGLVLLAAYSDTDLSDMGIHVFDIYGSRDGVLNFQQKERYNIHLPDDTVTLRIEGGNHAGFGFYGPQRGDQDATIIRDVQISTTATAVIQWIQAEWPTDS